MKNVKLVITGSSSLDIREVGSFLVGRAIFFDMHPFSFGEFLRARDRKAHAYWLENRISIDNPALRKEKPVFLDSLNSHINEYLAFGGYPAVVLEPGTEKKKTLLQSLFLTYVEKDVVRIYGSNYRQRVMDLVRQLASLNASILNYSSLASSIGLYEKEIKHVLSILEETFIISRIRPFHSNLTTELRKSPKAYFHDTGLRNAITGRFEFGEEEYGKLLENYVLNAVRGRRVNFWRTSAKAEVDFIIDGWLPVEAKRSGKITRSFRSFVSHYNPKRAFIAGMDCYEETKIGSTQVLFVPFSLICMD